MNKSGPGNKRSVRPPGAGREEKRRVVRERIADAGLQLFLSKGYDATTLDAIALSAGVSRRSIFSYFSSKDEILATWHQSSWAAVMAEVAGTLPEAEPLDVAAEVLVRNASTYSTDEMAAIDRMIRSSAVLMAGKPASYLRQELSLYAELAKRWPEPARQGALRLVAMLSIGAMRLAIENWQRSGGEKPISLYLGEAFAVLRGEMGTATGQRTRAAKSKEKRQSGSSSR